MARFMISGLRARLILLVLLAVIPALLLIFYTASEQRRLATLDAQSDVVWLTRLVAADQERLINDTRQLLLTLTHLSEVRRRDTTSCSNFFSSLLAEYPQYANLGAVSPEGIIFCSAIRGGLGANVSNRQFFQRASQEGKFVVGEYHVDTLTGTPAVYFAYPLVVDDGDPISVVFATLNLDWLNQVVAESQLREGATLILIDQGGTVLVHHPDPESWVGQNALESSLIETIFSRGSGFATLPGLDGINRLYSFTPITSAVDPGFYVAIGISEGVAFAQAERTMARNLIGLGIVILMALVLAWIGGDLFVLQRVRSLIAATNRLAKGDLGARTGLPYGQGELSQLARAFDQMTEALEAREIERQRAEYEIRRHNRDLAALNTVTATVSSSLELPEVLEGLKRLLAEELNVPGGVIYFYDANNMSLYVEAAWGVPASILANFKRFPAATLHYQQIVSEKEAVLKRDFREVIQFTDSGLHDARPDWYSYLGVPLLAKGEVQGVLDLFSNHPAEFTQDQVTLFCALGQQVGVAVQNARLFEQVRTGRRRLQILSQQLLEVQESERRHLARELHDEIGQALTAVKVNLQAAQRSQSIPAQISYLEESIAIVERTLQQVRNLSLNLRPSLLDDLGVVAALRWYIDRQAQRAGFTARFVADLSDERLAPEVETTCFRVVQEALTNVVRHAKATRVSVELRKTDQELELVIWDDGIGFDVDKVLERAAGDLSLGLLGMRERAQLIGGDVTINSDAAQGTKVIAYFPLDPRSFYQQKPILMTDSS